MKNENILVLAFSSDSYNLEELKSMTNEERYELASMCKMLGDTDTEICTLAKFQGFFNTGCVDAEHSYIFFQTK